MSLSGLLAGKLWTLKPVPGVVVNGDAKFPDYNSSSLSLLTSNGIPQIEITSANYETQQRHKHSRMV